MGRVLVVSASMGAGHHAAADELVRRVVDAGQVAERVDVLELGRPGAGRRLRRTYRGLVDKAPWAYGLVMRSWERWPAPWERLTAAGAGGYERGLIAQVERLEPDVVVSVYNLASQALGRLRRSGRLRVPVVTYVPDPGAHPYWISAGVDQHLAVLPGTARALRRRGAAAVVRVAPLLRALPQGHGEPRPEVRARARQRLGLPPASPIVLVSGGSWGCGHLVRTVTLLARSGTVLPVTLCGRNRELLGRLQGLGAGIAVGWTDEVPTWMDAVDVLVDNAGGLTCWEALARGVPVVVFRPLPGHGRLNARALESAGLAACPRRDDALLPAVRALLPGSGRAADQTARARTAMLGPSVEQVLGLSGVVPVGPGAGTGTNRCG